MGDGQTIEFPRHQPGVLRDVPIEELLGSFSLDSILLVDEYQTKTAIGTLKTKPLPTNFVDKYGDQAELLADNSESYDDEGEDLLLEDQVIVQIMDARRSDTSAELVHLIRVRRSVVTFILSHWKGMEEEQQLRKPA